MKKFICLTIALLSVVCAALVGVDAFENIEALASITEKDIMDCIDILFDNKNTAISIVESNT